ncbi:MAG: RNA pseudouridine synthase [Bacteroidota bacterium]
MNLHRGLKKIKFKELIIKDLDNYTIISKPPFLSSLEDRVNSQNLLHLAKEVNKMYQICHRLDKETSGLVVFAKNPNAYKHFALQLENREVKKIYHAIIHGLYKFENFEADEPLYTTSAKSRVDFKIGKPALTLISTIEIFKKHTFIKCFPVTGRMHQIRTHLSYHKAPIIQDHTYGGKEVYLSELKKNVNLRKDKQPKPMIERVALHAAEIAFKNLDGSIIESKASYHKDFLVLLKLLQKFN